jgi:hypothetical protein
MKAFCVFAVLGAAGAAWAAPVIVNGDFATGNLTGWASVGPVTVQNQVAYLQEVALENTQLQQTFTIPLGATKLRFEYAFDSTYIGGGSAGSDELWAYLLNPATNQPLLHTPGYQEFLYALRSGYRDYDPSIVTLTDLGGTPPWVRVELNLASLAMPVDARLIFSLFSWGNDGYSTRLAIDNAAVPLTPHPGDANNDGAVNVGDLGILAGNWGQSPRTWAQGNFTTPDTIVDVGDLGVLAGNWGWTGAPASGPVPEPATAAMILIGLLLLPGRRKAS